MEKGRLEIINPEKVKVEALKILLMIPTSVSYAMSYGISILATANVKLGYK